MDKAEAGAAIKRARERRRWTQQNLAERLGVDRKTVDNWENGRSSPRNRMGLIEEVLQVSLDGESARKPDVVAGRQDDAVYRRRDDRALEDAVRELRRGLDQTARGIEAASNAAKAIADHIGSEDEE